MTKDEIQQRLYELAEFENKPLTATDLRDSIYQSDDEDMVEEKSAVINELNQNVTRPYTLVKLKNCKNECPDCKCEVENRVVEYRWRNTPNRKYWRKHCSCGLIQNPFNGTMSVKAHGSAPLYAAFEKSRADTKPQSRSQHMFWIKHGLDEDDKNKT